MTLNGSDGVLLIDCGFGRTSEQEHCYYFYELGIKLESIL